MRWRERTLKPLCTKLCFEHAEHVHPSHLHGLEYRRRVLLNVYDKCTKVKRTDVAKFSIPPMVEIIRSSRTHLSRFPLAKSAAIKGNNTDADARPLNACGSSFLLRRYDAAVPGTSSMPSSSAALMTKFLTFESGAKSMASFPPASLLSNSAPAFRRIAAASPCPSAIL